MKKIKKSVCGIESKRKRNFDTGYHGSLDLRVIRLDKKGRIEWQRQFGWDAR